MTTTLISALISLVVYLLALLWLGAQSLGGQTNSADSYFLADRRLRAGVQPRDGQTRRLSKSNRA